MSPRTAEKDRAIDPLSGKKFARKRARTGFEPNGQADGRQPFMPRVSYNPCLLMLPFGFAHARRMRPLSVGRLDNAFHPATDHHAMVLNTCKEITVVWSGMVNRKRRRRRLSCWRSGARPHPLVGRLCRSTTTSACSPFRPEVRQALGFERGTIRLAYHTQGVESGRDTPATETGNRDRGHPEMIQAGEEAFWKYADLEFTDSAVTVELIFMARASVSPSQRIGQQSSPSV